MARATSESFEDFELLLAHAEDGQPVLGRGLLITDAVRAPRPGALPDETLPPRLRDDQASPNSLSRQRWGVIAPEGPDGDALLARIAPLIKARAEQQQADVIPPYRVAASMTCNDALHWVKNDLGATLAEADRPRYLLMLGDFHQVPLELQSALSIDHFVGRLAFASPDGYDSYVDKLLRSEREAARPEARAVTYTVRGSTATDDGYRKLMAPLAATSADLHERRKLPVAFEELGGDPASPDELLRLARDPRPTVLLSMSHGLGCSSRRPGEQRARQGAISFGPGHDPLTAADVGRGAFLPGGVWFLFACFGAGTPATSTYWHWLRSLASGDRRFDARVLDTLPQGNDPPFVAALPQAALANPDGPLAVLGHVDLAWSYSYDGRLTGGGSHLDRFLSLAKLAESSEPEPVRVGAVLSEFLRDLARINAELTDCYHEDEKSAKRGVARPVDPVKRARLWMLRQDLGAYVLLGDPAAHLPRPPVPHRSARAPDLRSPVPDPDVEMMAEAVLDLIRGDSSPQAVAARTGVPVGELQRWEQSYKDAGKAGLATLRRRPS